MRVMGVKRVKETVWYFDEELEYIIE